VSHLDLPEVDEADVDAVLAQDPELPDVPGSGAHSVISMCYARHLTDRAHQQVAMHICTGRWSRPA
jgi:hypothetical protein